jgi:hypothetical protein
MAFAGRSQRSGRNVNLREKGSNSVMKTKLAVGGVMVLAIAGCSEKIGPQGLSENPRFEILQKGDQGPQQTSRTILYDRNTGDVLIIEYTGGIYNRGPYRSDGFNWKTLASPVTKAGFEYRGPRSGFTDS